MCVGGGQNDRTIPSFVFSILPFFFFFFSIGVSTNDVRLSVKKATAGAKAEDRRVVEADFKEQYSFYNTWK